MFRDFVRELCGRIKVFHKLNEIQILDVIRYALLLQHPSDLDEAISRENANLSACSMPYSFGHLLHRIIMALSAASAILNLSQNSVDGVRYTNEFQYTENETS